VVGEVAITNGSSITTDALDAGHAGDIRIRAKNIEASDEVSIASRPFSAGAEGDIVVEVGRLTLTRGARIGADTFSVERGGSVTVIASDTLTLTGISGRFVGVFPIKDTSGVRPAKIVTIGGSPSGIFATALEPPVVPTTPPQVTIERGGAGSSVVSAPRIMVTDGARIDTSTRGRGPEGGSITVTASDTLTLTGGARISSASLGRGDPGRIAVTTPRLTLADRGRISTETSGDGNGGDVTVQAGSLILMNGAQISGSSGITNGPFFSVGAGRSGTVTVTATEPVLLTGQGTGLFTRTAGSGKGGDIIVQAPRVSLADGATISAESTGLGNAGNITLTLGDSFVSTHASIVTRATLADGGNIQIKAPNFLRLRDSAITAEEGGGTTTVGGNISIDPQFVPLQNNQIVANAFAGQGGKISIQAQQVFLADPTSQVSASSALGINGQVDIQAPVTNVSGAVTPLTQAFARAGELLRDRCGERVRGGTVSRFVLGGRDGVPLEPGSLLLSPLVREE
jgi:large exoprotein involved in heme utilization and adhesion